MSGPDVLLRVSASGLLSALMLLGSTHGVLAQTRAAPPPPPPPEARLEVRVFPGAPVVEQAAGQQQLNFEFRLDAVGGPLRLLNVLVRLYDAQGALLRYRQLVPANYQGNFSDVALYGGNRFQGSSPFDVSGPIPAGGRVLFMNPWHSFALDEPLIRLQYTFYSVDDRGRVNTTAVEVKPVAAQPQIALRLPVAGRWLVVEGHDYETHHRRIFSPVNAQRFASDFVALQPGDLLYANDGTRVGDYASFGADVLAPAAGTVVARENGLADNPVGARDDVNPLGNHVVVDHGGGLFSVLAHLQKGSLGVSVGDRVASGQKLGKVGNSGASDLPHLHYHLQNGPDLAVNRAEGVVALFSRYRRLVGAREVPVEQGSPATGELVLGDPAANAGAAPAPPPSATPKTR